MILPLSFMPILPSSAHFPYTKIFIRIFIFYFHYHHMIIGLYEPIFLLIFLPGSHTLFYTTYTIFFSLFHSFLKLKCRVKLITLFFPYLLLLTVNCCSHLFIFVFLCILSPSLILFILWLTLKCDIYFGDIYLSAYIYIYI